MQAAKNLPTTMDHSETGLVSKSWSVLVRRSSLIRRMVKMGTTNMKMKETLESMVPKLELTLMMLPKAKKMPDTNRKLPMNT